MSWEDVNTHRIIFCTYKRTENKHPVCFLSLKLFQDSNSLSYLAFQLTWDFADFSDEACFSGSQQCILGTLVNPNKTSR